MYENQINKYQDHIKDIIKTKSPSKKIPKLKKFLEFIEKEEKILKEQYPNGIYPDSDNDENKNKEINQNQS